MPGFNATAPFATSLRASSSEDASTMRIVSVAFANSANPLLLQLNLLASAAAQISDAANATGATFGEEYTPTFWAARTIGENSSNNMSSKKLNRQVTLFTCAPAAKLKCAH